MGCVVEITHREVQGGAAGGDSSRMGDFFNQEGTL